MLIRPHDDGSQDDERWRRFVIAQGFGQFVASGRGRSLPVVVPTQFLLDSDHVLFHLAAPNPVFARLEENAEALLSVAGDWTYIPGAWKAIDDEDPRFGIPTTYYAAVQLTGSVTVLHEPEAIADILRRQRGSLEPGVDYADPMEHGQKLRAIRGIDLAITEVHAKFKFGGNVDQRHRDHVAAQLRKRGGAGDEAALAHLLLTE